MANESKTMNLVRELLRGLGYGEDGARVEEQRSDDPRVNKLLRAASKKGGGKGFPDFIITHSAHPGLVIVVECKADPARHVSETLDSYEKYAVDGALLYASFLAKEFDVVAVGVSGEDASQLRITHFLRLQGGREEHEMFGGDFLTFAQYHQGIKKSDVKFRQDYYRLLACTKTLNELLHAKKIKEAQRALLISGVLIALRSDAFYSGYKKHKSVTSLVDSLCAAIDSELLREDTPPGVARMMTRCYSFLRTNPALSDKETGKDLLEYLIETIHEEVGSFMVTYQYVDTLSQFYVEFLRYANNDKGLGIVLTPPHITELFAALARVDKHSVVLDSCCGTGGFLISAMKAMLVDAKGDEARELSIKGDQLIGIEYQDDIYTLLVSNMILHHNDARGDMHWGSCFKEAESVKELHKEKPPNVGLLNPPYRTKASDQEEFAFVLNNLDMLAPGGTCIALVPLSCCIERTGAAHALRSRILERHTLEGVLSLPEEIFHNSKVNIVTCAVIITAHRPHPKGKKTWFGYCRDDGFVKVKNLGRVDGHRTWDSIRTHWVNAFHNREVIDGFSVMQEVSAADEWCAEAFLKTDYTKFTLADYEKTVKQFLLFCMMDQSSREEEEGDDGDL